jgi:hypothetical protein
MTNFCDTLDTFIQTTISEQNCPSSLSKALQALWYDKKGDWQTAHEITQEAKDADSAWVHAYLHRKEGDFSNAQYWYRRSGKPASQASLEQEWEEIAKELLINSRNLTQEV